MLYKNNYLLIINILKTTLLLMVDNREEQRKSSTMNSMFIGSTISKPNVDAIINAVATILHSQMLEVTPPPNTITANQSHMCIHVMLTLVFVWHFRIKVRAE